MAPYLGKPLEELNLIVCHLGTGGSSIDAIQKGQSIDTSMGYSPLAGLMMGTRTGDLDPLLPVYMLANLGFTSQELNDLFNRKSGLLGVSGISSDLRDLLPASQEGDNRATLAVEMYTYRLRKMIGAYTCLLGGADALVFTTTLACRFPACAPWPARVWSGAALPWTWWPTPPLLLASWLKSAQPTAARVYFQPQPTKNW